MTLSVKWESCVRSRSRAATCRACVDGCPVKAISLDGPRASVKVDLEACTSCGRCQAVCPTEVFHGVADVTAFVEHAGSTLSCSSTFCLSLLTTEDFVTLALRHGTVKVDGAGCTTCRATPSLVGERVERATSFLAASGFAAKLVEVVKPGAPPAAVVVPAPVVAAPSRRTLLRRLVPGAEPTPRAPLALAPLGSGALDPVKVKDKPLPARRERLLAQLGASSRERGATALPGAEVDFTSDKVLDLTTCTGCLQCVSACPTAALTSSRGLDEVRFDAARCVKCGTCHDVCEPRSLTLALRFDTASLTAGARSLARFTVKACTECGVRFKYDGGDAICPRCAGHDDEARALHGLPTKPPGASA